MASLTFDDAVKKMIQQYYATDELSMSQQSEMDKHDKMKYNKKYFDNFQAKNGIGVPKQEEPAPTKAKPKKPSNTNKDAIPMKPTF